PALLNIVAASRVLGVARPSNKISATGSANMLKLGQQLCQHVLPAASGQYDLNYFLDHGSLQWGDETGLIDVNGDAELWRRLCAHGNRMIVRVPQIPTTWAEALKGDSSRAPIL